LQFDTGVTAEQVVLDKKFPDMQEVQVVADVEQFSQGDVHATHEEAEAR
jgi:hypothetical protein